MAKNRPDERSDPALFDGIEEEIPPSADQQRDAGQRGAEGAGSRTRQSGRTAQQKTKQAGQTGMRDKKGNQPS